MLQWLNLAYAACATKNVAQSNNIKLGSCHASHARPSQHFVQTITATLEHHITVQITQHATRHAIAAACSDLSGSGWNQAKTQVPSSHCGKFHFAHHLTCCNGLNLAYAACARRRSLRATMSSWDHAMHRMHGLHNTSFRPSLQRQNTTSLCRSLNTQDATRHSIAAACSDSSGSGWNQAKTLVPGSHCGKFHVAHHRTCCNG